MHFIEIGEHSVVVRWVVKKRTGEPLEVLEATKAWKILLYLAEVNEAPITKIPQELNLSTQTVYNTLQVLLQYGLVGERREENVFPRRRLIFLTEKGRRVAELLKQIEKEIEDP